MKQKLDHWYSPTTSFDTSCLYDKPSIKLRAFLAIFLPTRPKESVLKPQ